jgi:hypothetical protein
VLMVETDIITRMEESTTERDAILLMMYVETSRTNRQFPVSVSSLILTKSLGKIKGNIYKSSLTPPRFVLLNCLYQTRKVNYRVFVCGGFDFAS